MLNMVKLLTRNNKIYNASRSEADIILLNDFWSEKRNSLLLPTPTVRGTNCNLPVLRNTNKYVQQGSDPGIRRSITRIRKIIHQNKSNEVDQEETKIMSVKWKTFKFHKLINKQHLYNRIASAVPVRTEPQTICDSSEKRL